MLNTRLTNCPACADIPNLVSEIDCKLTEASKDTYNKLVYAINAPCKKDVISDLLNYRRILIHRYCNSEYAGSYSLDEIVSKVKLLINK